MGTDIHSVAQVRRKWRPSGWVTVVERPAGDGRNYDTFAVLANVRNGVGFAGVSTGEAWPIIDEPRGLPKDFKLHDYTDPDYPDEGPMEGYHGTTWMMGDHSHSWVTLAEMKSIWEKLKDRDYLVEGVVTVSQYRELKTGKAPDDYCGAIWGRDVLVVTELQAKVDPSLLEKATHVQCEWQVPSSECLWLFKKYIDVLEATRAAHEVTDEDVRLVFGFDS